MYSSYRGPKSELLNIPGFNHGLLPLLNAIVLTIEKLIQIVYPGEKSKRRL